ncbi:MAG: ABC transporter permease [Bacteroidales bacterium]|nr:ABC transporter permease [Bacteroidales bacterium]
MNYFARISLRRLAREKLYTVINITGLALGMASAVLILLFLRFETTYDNWHTHKNDIYRLGIEMQIFDQQQNFAVSSAGLAPLMVNEFSELQSYVRVFHVHYFLRDIVYRYNDRFFYDSDVFAVDSTFFDFFTYDFLEGNPRNVLAAPFSIVLTRSMANEIFGNSNAVGKKLWVKNTGFFTVTAVVEDSPLNTHFHFNALISVSTLYELDQMFEQAFGRGVHWSHFENTLGSLIVWSYIMTNEDFDPDDFLENHWPDFHEKHITELIEKHQIDLKPVFQQLTSIHIDEDMLYDRSKEKAHIQTMNRQLVRVFFVIAIFLLLVAAINYTNILISHFNKRKKEMAIIKVLGSGSRQLFAGFFVESFVTALVSLFIALFMVELIIPFINDFLGLDLKLRIADDYMIGVIIFSVFFLTSFLAGLFPAVYFAQISTINLLMQRMRAGRKSILLKKVLVTIQFTISAFMISASFVAYQQMNYMQRMDPGYEYQNIAVLEIHDNDIRSNLNLLDSLFLENPKIEKTASSNYIFSSLPIKHTALFEKDNQQTVRSFNTIQTTGKYLELMGVKIFAGDKKINPEILDKTNGVFVNRAFVDSMGYDDPIGKIITTHFQFLEGRLRANRPIAGVMDDFHYAALHEPVEPLIVMGMRSLPNYYIVRFYKSDRAEQLNIIHSVWDQFDPYYPAEFYFLEDIIEDFFIKQSNLSRFFGYFAWLCVLISFLGVFGITAYNMEQRTVEIGIRKVMGAGWLDIFSTFFNDYLILLIIACISGVAISYKLLGQWLAGFEYAVKISFLPFLIAIIMVTITVWLAIGIHALRTMYINPSKALKCE